MKKPRLITELFIVTVALSFVNLSVSGQSQTFTTSGTFTVPAGVTSIVVECWGGGGAGGGTNNNGVKSGGGGGAGGAYARKTLTVTPGSTYTVTVAAPVTGTQTAGATGNPSWFESVSTVFAEGGAGGAAPNAGIASGGIGSTANSIGDILFPGGNGENGDGTISGGGGGGAGSGGPGGNASGMTGGSGTSLNGGNGASGFNAESDGGAGLNYGGGGSGAFVPKNRNHPGGNGAQGLVVISWSFIVFNANGTFVVPDGVSSLSIECWGGGGAGGGSTSGTYAGGGGGGGGYSFATISVTPGNSYSVTVGTGGTGGTGNGPGGGDTYFDNPAVIMAKGGQGGFAAAAAAHGNGGTGGSSASGTGSVKYSGGNGAAGGSGPRRGGGGGSSAGTGANGNAGSGTTGGTAPAGGGNGGNGGTQNVSGTNGSAPGGAGGGSGSSASGGSGANGRVVITWVPPVYYSQLSGDPNLFTSWKTVSGYSPSNFTSASQSFIIQSGHTMTTTASGWTVSGGNTLVRVSGGATLTETTPINISANTILSIDNAATLNHNVNSTTIFSGTEFFGSSSTTIYGLAGNQSVVNAVYGNLTFSASGVKTYATITVNGILSLEGTATASASLAIPPAYGPNASLRYNGSVAQTTGPEFPSTFSAAGGVIIDNINGVTLGGTYTISSLLTFNNGKITTGVNNLILGTAASVSGAGTGKYVYGNLQKNIGASTVTKFFEIGDASVYAPVSISFAGTTNGTGNIVANTTSGDHPNIGTSSISPANTINRYWTITNNGVTGFTSFAPTFNFVAGDIDAGVDFSTVIIGNYTGGIWNYPTMGTRTSTSSQATGLTTFGDFQIGNIFTNFRTRATGAWDQLPTWEMLSGGSWIPSTIVPTSSVGIITLQSPYTVTINSSTTVDQVTLSPGATLVLNSGVILADGPGTDLQADGTIDCGSASVMTGAGAFVLSSGASIIIRSATGISAAGATGNIQTASRSFSSGANYNYSGSSAQITGNGLPLTVSNLTINNSSGVSLSSSVTVTGTLSLSSGAFSTGSSALTFHTSNTPISRTTGTITTSATTDLAFGSPGNTGGAAFAIPAGTFTAPPVIRNLTINRTNTLTLNDQLMSVSGVVLCNGPLNTNDNLALLSTAVQTALIDGSGTGSINGSVTMQRYLPSGFGYKYLSSPFQAAFVSELADDINLAAAFPSVYKYDESRLSSGWVSYVNPLNILNPMMGYSVNFYSSPIVPNTVDITGTVNNGPLSVTLYNNNRTYTKGFNLVGNPYPSPINWDAAGWTKTNIDNAIYLFKSSLTDQYGGTYSSYINGISSDGIANSIIPSMQGFFVHVTDGAYPVTATLGFSNNTRVTSSNPPFFKSAKSSPLQFARITAEYSGDPASVDPAVIYFDPSGTENMDNALDALKLFNTDLTVPNIYSVSASGNKLSISALPPITLSPYQVPLGVKANRDGTIVIKLKDSEESLSANGIFLYDAVTGISQDLLNGNQYSVTLVKGEYLNRFWLNFGSVITSLQKQNENSVVFSVYSASGIVKAQINRLSGAKGDLTIYNILGQPVFTKKIPETGSYEFAPALKDGIYIINFVSGNDRISKKLYIGGR